jgi:hypothetical protein
VAQTTPTASAAFPPSNSRCTRALSNTQVAVSHKKKKIRMHLLGLGVQVLLESDAELFPQGLELLEVLGVLALVLDLGLDA